MDKTGTILVTGGAGFIGSNLCETLLNRGHRVVCFDNLSTGDKGNIAEYLKNKNFKFIRGDCNTDDLEKAFKGNRIDYVFHYAAVVGVKKTIENPLLVMNDIEGLKRICELSRKHDVKKIVYSSSSEVYGEPAQLPEKEEGITNAKMPYALVKLIGERYMKAYNDKYGVKTTSLRFFNVYGPKQISSAYGFVVGIFIKQALANKNLTIFGNGKQTRDFVYIKDNINASILAMEKDETNGQSINIGTGKSITVLELAKKIIKHSGKEGLRIDYVERRPSDIVHRRPDVTKMKRIIGYEPQCSLDEGLKMTIEWFKKEQSKGGHVE